jgi:hypothetical protein
MRFGLSVLSLSGAIVVHMYVTVGDTVAILIKIGLDWSGCPVYLQTAQFEWLSLERKPESAPLYQRPATVLLMNRA